MGGHGPGTLSHVLVSAAGAPFLSGCLRVS